MKKIGIVGSRRRNSKKDYEALEKAFFQIYKVGDEIVSGGCALGADNMAEIIASKYNIPIKIHYPDKSKLDKKKLIMNPKWAYAEINFARNTLIAQDCDVLICVVASDRKGGTENTLEKAKALNKTIILVEEVVGDDIDELWKD